MDGEDESAGAQSPLIGNGWWRQITSHSTLVGEWPLLVERRGVCEPEVHLNAPGHSLSKLGVVGAAPASEDFLTFLSAERLRASRTTSIVCPLCGYLSGAKR